MRVIDFDHLVLNVTDIERSLAFYRDKLGLAPVRVDEWRAGKAPFPSVRVSPTTIIDLVQPPGDTAQGSNVDHICLVVEPLDWQQVVDSGEFTVLDGPGPRFGARGTAQSLYVRDPDGNTVELRWYPQAGDGENADPS
ncbi:VOC family protein [Streptantibioticus rubrisoli]|uniref:VOC family protein n=1 Tax=Streptantibioticus rubrisoli TaxID=1387313 RepID=A0ABT1PCC6_9ACTN|nr:VOC family protein [Streptantibioticus rubrisoli]MCQ4043031.1 VOC family protein [Streptantibioticus rubrisoli]